MIARALQRRFGYGAARLPLAQDLGPGLSARATSRAAYEEIIAVMPGVFAVLLAVSAGLGLLADRPLERTRTPIEITHWTPAPAPPAEAPAAEPRPVPAAPAPPRAQPRPASPPAEALTEAAPSGPAETAPPPFVLPRMQAPTLPTETVAAMAPQPGRAGAFARRPGPKRPHPPSPQGAGWQATAAPSDVLDPTASSVGDPTGRPAALRATRPPPAVAARPDGLVAAANAASSGSGTGWAEVPLDALPDCSPPERQDQLKQRLLRIVTSGETCSNGEARFRFVEARNLGAFLLYTQPGAARPFRAERARDACEVLEAALRCLAGGAGPSSPLSFSNESVPKRS